MKKYKVICPLYGFQIQRGFMVPVGMPNDKVTQVLNARIKQLAEGIELFDGIKVRGVSREDIEDFSRKPWRFLLPRGTVISSDMFVLEKFILKEGVPDLELAQSMRNIVLAMRLLKRGHVSFQNIFFILMDEKRQLNAWTHEGRIGSQFDGYILDFDEIPHLQEMVKKVQGLDFDKRKSLRLACRRFQHAYEEEDFEDKLIDFMIAFEALFVKGGKGEKSQIISAACSMLLGKTDKEREKIRIHLMNAYTVRNKVVHGQEYDKKKYDLFQIVPVIGDYLRESIKKLLD